MNIDWLKVSKCIWRPKLVLSVLLILLAVYFSSMIDLRPNVPYFYIDKFGKTVMKGTGYLGNSFKDGLALVCEEYHENAHTQNFKYIDRLGKTQIRISAMQAFPFSEGLAVVRIWTPQGGKSGYINHQGEWVIQPQFLMADAFSDGVASVVTVFGHPQYIDHSGRILFDALSIPDVFPLPFVGTVRQRFCSFSEGLAAVKINSYWGYINKNAHWVVRPYWHNESMMPWNPFCEGLAAIPGKNQEWGYIDKVGKAIGLAGFCDFSEGYAAINKHGLWGYVDRSGQLVIPPRFQAASVFSEGKAAVTVNGKVGYIDRKGSWLIAPQYAYGGDFSDGVAIVIPFIRGKRRWFKPEALMWGTPAGKYFARRPMVWVYPERSD